MFLLHLTPVLAHYWVKLRQPGTLLLEILCLCQGRGLPDICSVVEEGTCA